MEKEKKKERKKEDFLNFESTQKAKTTLMQDIKVSQSQAVLARLPMRIKFTASEDSERIYFTSTFHHDVSTADLAILIEQESHAISITGKIFTSTPHDNNSKRRSRARVISDGISFSAHVLLPSNADTSAMEPTLSCRELRITVKKKEDHGI